MYFDNLPADEKNTMSGQFGDLPTVIVNEGNETIPYFLTTSYWESSPQEFQPTNFTTAIYIESLQRESYAMQDMGVDLLPQKLPFCWIVYETGSHKVEIELNLSYDWRKVVENPRNLEIIGRVISREMEVYKRYDLAAEESRKAQWELMGHDYIVRRCRATMILGIDTAREYKVADLVAIAQKLLPNIELVPVTPTNCFRFENGRKFLHQMVGIQER